MKVGSIANVVSNSTIKQHWFLEDYSNLGPQPGDIELHDIALLCS